VVNLNQIDKATEEDQELQAKDEEIARLKALLAEK